MANLLSVDTGVIDEDIDVAYRCSTAKSHEMLCLLIKHIKSGFSIPPNPKAKY
jgi:hypothetical protein